MFKMLTNLYSLVVVCLRTHESVHHDGLHSTHADRHFYLQFGCIALTEAKLCILVGTGSGQIRVESSELDNGRSVTNLGTDSTEMLVESEWTQLRQIVVA